MLRTLVEVHVVVFAVVFLGLGQVRTASNRDEFLLNPFGLLYQEITATSLVKVDVNGEVLDEGSTRFGISKAGYTLHSAIHAARPEIQCVIHVHTRAGAAVSGCARFCFVLFIFKSLPWMLNFVDD